MKTTKLQILIAIFLIVVQRGYTQGTFQNLNFESANVSGASGGYIPTSAALPGWTAYYGPSSDPTSLSTPLVAYDGVSLGAALVVLVDSNAPSGSGLGDLSLQPIQGNYSVLLEGSIPSAASTASIGQTATIPNTVQSLVFWGDQINGNLQVSFNGQPLSFLVTGSTASYSIYSADISAYAGHTGQLLFTAPVQIAALFDNIQFSNLPIPEPGVFGLSALGVLLLGWGVLRQR